MEEALKLAAARGLAEAVVVVPFVVQTLRTRVGRKISHAAQAMLPEPKRYHSLPAQVAERIAGEIRALTWNTTLPAERVLIDSLQVSRKTLRKALGLLQREGLIESQHRLGHRIVERAERARPREVSVGLLTAESLERLPSYTALWIDELRTLLFESGVRLATFSGRVFFTQSPEKALTKLVQQNPQGCWVLAHSNERMQRWLEERGVPCLIAGSSYGGATLPNVDLDHFGVGRHAAGALLRQGHRRVAFLIHQSQRGGDIESEQGFVEGVRASAHPDAEAIILRHDGTVGGAAKALARGFARAQPPTAVLVARPVFYLTAQAFLGKRGLRVPEDVSLVSRDNDTFLEYLIPAPACYSLSPKIYAKRLFSLSIALTRGEAIAQPRLRIEPTFKPGPSLAPPPAALTRARQTS